MKTNIPEKFQLKLPIHHNTFLIDGKIGNWNGEFTEVVSTLFSNSENDKYTVLGDSPKMDEKHALLAASETLDLSIKLGSTPKAILFNIESLEIKIFCGTCAIFFCHIFILLSSESS